MASVAVLASRAHELGSQGENYAAVETCLQALDQGAADPQLLTSLAAAYHRLGMHENAVAASFAACVVAKPPTTRLCDLGVRCEHAGLLVEAQAAFEAALDLNPLHCRARRHHWSLVRSLRRERNECDLTRSLAMRAARFLRQEQYDRAFAVADELEALLPRTGAADLLRGAIYERTGDGSQAAECYASAERFDPIRARDARQRGRAKITRQKRAQVWPLVREAQELLDVGDDEGAARIAAKLVGVVPDTPAPYLLWARVAARKGSYRNAIQNLGLALSRAGAARGAIAEEIGRLGERLRNNGQTLEEAAS